jgi:hypothetical protein
MIVGSLAAADVWTYLVKRGDNLSATLSPAPDESVEPTATT